MLMIDPLFQRALVAVCRERGVPVILDEVFTGLYRLGAPSAASLLGLLPDIACYAKLLTGGTVPLAATVTTEEVFDSFRGDSKLQALLHGHSYSAHAIGCQAAAAALSLLTDPASNPNLRPDSFAVKVQGCAHAVQGQCGSKGSETGFGLPYCSCRASGGRLDDLWDSAVVERISHLDRVQRVVSLGTVLAMELKSGGVGGYASHASKSVVLALRGRGVFARPLGDVVYLMAAPTTPRARCSQVLDQLLQVLEGYRDDGAKLEADIV